MSLKTYHIAPLSRRTVLKTIIGFFGTALTFATSRGFAANRRESDFLKKIKNIEAQSQSRLGVTIYDSAYNKNLSYRANERFPFCSTIKILIVAAILTRVDRGQETMDREIAYTADDVLSYAPVAKQNLDKASMSIEELCAATMEWSDNTAANLLLHILGGPTGLTAYARSIGDKVTRLDRIEPDLNSAISSDDRDTTSPAAMTENLRSLLFGNALSEDSRQHLENWMTNSKTGLKRLRAGLPGDWRVGDKTGTGDNGTSNIVAIIRPPHRAPLLAAIYMTGSPESGEARDAAIADIGRLIASLF